MTHPEHEDTEEVDFAELQPGDVIFSDNQEQSGVVREVDRDFGKVILEDGRTPELTSPVTIRKRLR